MCLDHGTARPFSYIPQDVPRRTELALPYVWTLERLFDFVSLLSTSIFESCFILRTFSKLVASNSSIYPMHLGTGADENSTLNVEAQATRVGLGGMSVVACARDWSESKNRTQNREPLLKPYLYHFQKRVSVKRSYG